MAMKELDWTSFFALFWTVSLALLRPAVGSQRRSDVQRSSAAAPAGGLRLSQFMSAAAAHGPPDRQD
jgi:hypothetical protein